MGVRLVDLDPHWISHGGKNVRDAAGNPVPERERVGVFFDCPCGCGEPCALHFANPPDGGPQLPGTVGWHREGDTFETLTLRPSILRCGGCGWHGFLTNGVFESC